MRPPNSSVVLAALFRGEGLLHRTLEVMDFALDETGLLLQARTFFGKALLDDVLDRGADLDQIGG